MSNPTAKLKPAPTAASSCFSAWWVGALLVLFTVALYWPVLGHDFVDYDDTTYVLDNPNVTGGLTWASVQWAFENSYACNWHPITWMSHMLDCNLFGLNPWGHHLTGVLFHALNVLLVFLLLRCLTGAFWRSAVVAALFGWHPVNVESVAWVAERKTVLSTCFGLLTLLFYGAYARKSEARSRKSGAGGAAFYIFPTYWLAWICLALGLLSKSILVTWPFVLLLVDYWPLDRWEPGRWRPLLREKIPFIVLAAATSVVTFMAHKEGGDMVAFNDIPVGGRIANAVMSYGRYLGKLFWPADLAFFYPYHWHWPTEEVLLASVCLGGLSVCFYMQRRHRPFLLMGWLWFGGTLVPVIGLVQVGGQALADRHAYIPSVGVLIMAVWGVCEMAGDWRFRRIGLSAAGLGAAIVCLALARHQIGYWQSSETLSRHALAVTENNCVAHDILGNVFFGRGQTAAAISEFQQAIQMNPKYSLAHNNLGSALFRQGQTEEAISQFRAAIQFEPDYALAYFNLGIALTKDGQTDEAASQFQQGLRFAPSDPDAHDNLGNLLALQGETDAAINQFEEALRLRPDYAQVHNRLGAALFKKGQTDAAISHYQAAIRLKPDSAESHNNLGIALASQGQTGLAIGEFQEALRLNPNDASFHNNLGIALTSQGQTDAAISQFQQTLRLKPDDAEAGNDLGYLWTERGEHLDEARALIEMAVKSNPQDGDFLGSMGWVLLKLNRPGEALDYLRRAVAGANPPDADLYDHLGDVYAALQQHTEAVGAWQKSVAIKPNPLVGKKLHGSSAP